MSFEIRTIDGKGNHLSNSGEYNRRHNGVLHKGYLMTSAVSIGRVVLGDKKQLHHTDTQQSRRRASPRACAGLLRADARRSRPWRKRLSVAIRVGGCVVGACGLSGRSCLGLCVGVCASCLSVSQHFL